MGVYIHTADGLPLRTTWVRAASAALYAYDAFGFGSAGGSVSFPHRFSTKPYDEDLMLSDFGRRWYWPEIRRWINRDPIEEEGGENLYAFCGNNPVLFFDPFGLQLPYLGDFGDPVSLPYYENTPPYGPYYPNASDGLSYWEGGMKYFFGDGSDVTIPIDQLGLSSRVQDYFNPCDKASYEKGHVVKDLLRLGNISKAGPGRVTVHWTKTLSFEGKKWTYLGFLSVNDEKFNFDRREWGKRDPNSWIKWKEGVTRIIAGLGKVSSAKVFTMHFEGELLVFGKGCCP